MTKKEIIDLLKSGNFTVASHDYGQVVLYEGKVPGYTESDDDDMPIWGEAKEVARFNIGESEGYMQKIVELMTEALGGSNGGSA